MKPTACLTCGAAFPSRNRLFRHLTESGHGAGDGSGGRRRGRGRDDDGDDGEADAEADASDADGGTPPSEGNDAYYEYYLRQRICSADAAGRTSEEAWDDAYRRLRAPLPASYRLHASSPLAAFAARLLARWEGSDEEGASSEGFGAEGGDGDGDGDGDAPAPAADEKARPKGSFRRWSFGTDDDASIPQLRMTVAPRARRRRRKGDRGEDDESDARAPILHALQELGAVQRQELSSSAASHRSPLAAPSEECIVRARPDDGTRARSAIPPLVLWANGSLGRRKEDEGAPIAADLCAAPGSKSLQLLDLLHASGSDGVPSGLLVANDADRKRVVTLCRRSRRVPRAPLLVLNADARRFPGMRRTAGYKQKYDKVLCDVPCSGDGTTRKNRRVWRTWSVPHAMSLHRLQRKILRRGMELLRPGGTIVYSTCSLNPLECEAVVASVIDDAGGVKAMEVVPLPEWLVSRCGTLKGLRTWRVPSPEFGKGGVDEMYPGFDDVPMEQRGGEGKEGKGGPINRSMFPPGETSELSSQLGNCGRFLPNAKMDSGGFFVSCIRRLQAGELGTKPTPSASESLDTSAANADGVGKLDKSQESATSAKKSSDDTAPPTSDEKNLREGDWICASCKENNFARRGRCFRCKARKPAMKKTHEGKVQQPLLASHPTLQSFWSFFGIPSESRFVRNARAMCRAPSSKRPSEVTIVVVSDALRKLAISDSWGPVREVGMSLAAVPISGETEKMKNSELRLFDEGLHLIAANATRRHLKLQPTQFRNALAQSIKFSFGESSSSAEVERVKATLDRSFLKVDSLCENDVWYEALDHPTAKMWAECIETPGPFILSCDCFVFGGSVDSCGTVSYTTSLRIAAAMLVALQYSEVA
ncbi:hypothetical protein ACHAWF_003849, partial [Thalassiosira exigua]